LKLFATLFLSRREQCLRTGISFIQGEITMESRELAVKGTESSARNVNFGSEAHSSDQDKLSAKDLAQSIYENVHKALKDPDDAQALEKLREDALYFNKVVLRDHPSALGTEVDAELEKLRKEDEPAIGTLDTTEMGVEHRPDNTVVSGGIDLWYDLPGQHQELLDSRDKDSIQQAPNTGWMHIGTDGKAERLDSVLNQLVPGKTLERKVPNKAGWDYTLD
jgi:hypothetical protein